jgi:hypothetical protein
MVSEQSANGPSTLTQRFKFSDNLVRVLMQKAAHLHQVALNRISFKGSLDTLRHWAQAIHACAKSPRKQAELINRMLDAIPGDLVHRRPGRLEPAPRKTTQNLSASHPTRTPNKGHRPPRKIPCPAS